MAWLVCLMERRRWNLEVKRCSRMGWHRQLPARVPQDMYFPWPLLTWESPVLRPFGTVLVRRGSYCFAVQLGRLCTQNKATAEGHSLYI